MIKCLSSDDSKSSDEEFWDSFENPELVRKGQLKRSIDPSKFTFLRLSEKERYEKTITNIRDSKEEEMRSLKIKVENKTKKELFSSINQIKTNLQKESLRFQGDFADFRLALQKKDKEIINLHLIIADQEYLISKLRVLYKKRKSSQHQPPQTNQINNLKLKIKAYKLQVNTLKELCEQYKNEIDKNKDINTKLKEENRQIKNKYENVLKNIDDLTNAKYENIIKERDNALDELKKIRSDTNKEIEVREMLNIRQEEIIVSLKEEINNFKQSLNNPRIKHRDLGVFKDKEIVKDFKVKEDSNDDGGVKVDVSTEIRMKKAKTSSLPKYTQCFKPKVISNYSYKEYKAFNPENSRNSLLSLRAASITPRIENCRRRNSKFNYSNESRKKISKNSVLLSSNTEEY